MRKGNIDKKWELMAKYISDETNHFEAGRFESLINNDEDTEELFLSSKKAWDEAGYTLQFEKINAERAFEKVNRHITQNKKVKNKIRNRYLVVSLGSVAVIILLGISLMIQRRAHGEEMLTISTQENCNDIVLNDGSEINLNRMSSLFYPSEFQGDNRTVKFTGEGFFSIAPDVNKPFKIEVGDLNVKVLGTAFNIKAYPSDETMEVTVDHGKVEVSIGNNNVILTKGYKAVFEKKNKLLTKQLNDDINYSSWKTGEIEFEQTPMKDVKSTIESVYGIKVNISDSSIYNNNLTARFHHSDIESVMMVISRTFNLNYSQTGSVYRLYDPSRDK